MSQARPQLALHRVSSTLEGRSLDIAKVRQDSKSEGKEGLGKGRETDRHGGKVIGGGKRGGGEREWLCER